MCLQIPVVDFLKKAWFLGFLLIFSGCALLGSRDGPPSEPPGFDVSKIPDAIPKKEPLSRYGNPESYKVFGKTYHVRRDANGYSVKGKASWYGTKFHGKRTSSGEPYDMFKMTAAHKTLPLPSYVKVHNLENGREIVVRVNDRGPFHDDRVIDLSYVAARKLGIFGKGTADVEVSVIEPEVDSGVIQATELLSDTSVFVQVGAFSQRENAQRLKQQLRDVEIESGIQIAGIGANRRIFRVRVGPFHDRATANKVAESLKGMGLSEARIVID